jgi:hypothetical protein
VKYPKTGAIFACIISSLLTVYAATHPKFASHSSTSKACAVDLNSCLDQGCGGGDRLLNSKKNRLTPPATDYQVISFDDFRHLEEERPTTWKENQSRKEVETLGEDTAVMLTGYLYGAHPGSPETCNCKLSGETNNDYHVNIVEHADDLMTDSIVVEMTPKWRAKIPEWTLMKLQSLPKPSGGSPLVRVSGYLLFDSEHVSRSGGERATIWEIHPVTRFEYCASGSCKPDEDDGWLDLHSAH